MRTDADHWLRFFAGLAAWRKLPTSAREALLLLQPSRLRSGAPSAAVRLADKGWLESGPDGKDRVPLGRAAMYHLIATLGGVDPFAGADDSPALLGRYLKQHFEQTDLTPICSGSWGGWDVPTVAKKVCTQAWIDSFLNGQAPRWEARLSGWLRRHYFSSPNIMGCAQRMLSRAKASPGPLPLSDLLDAGRADKLETAFKALTGLLRYLLVFAGLHPDTLEPQIGLWPELTARLHRPPAGLPATVEPVEVFHQPHLADDLAVLLTTAASAPLRLKANGCDLFAKDAAEMIAAFPPLPAWLPATLLDNALRLEQALGVAVALKFAHGATDAETQSRRLEALPAGRAWLGLGARERLERLLAAFRTRRGGNDSGGSFAIAMLPAHPCWAMANQHRILEPAAAVLESWRHAPARRFVPAERLFDFLGQAHNPLLNLLAEGEVLCEFVSSGWSTGYFEMTPENVERRGWELVRAFFLRRLVPLGGVRLGRAADGTLLFEMTDIGRYLLGETKTFNLPEVRAGELVVQPNFEIVFLDANLAAEAELAPFCARAGRGHGVLFRLTRESCLRASRAGLTADAVLVTLARLSTKPVPRNVQQEVAAWFSQARTVQPRRALLFECPDVETAGQMVSALKGGTRLLNPTMVEFPEAKLSSAQLKRLQTLGIFVGALPGKRGGTGT